MILGAVLLELLPIDQLPANCRQTRGFRQGDRTEVGRGIMTAFGAAMHDAREHGSVEVAKHLRNAPTRRLATLGHGEGYRHAHDEPDGCAAGERYLPDALQQRRYYDPTGRGLEGRIAKMPPALRALDEAARSKPRRGQ